MYIPGVNSACLGSIVGLKDAHQSVGLFKHVITKADDNKLGILGTLL